MRFELYQTAVRQGGRLHFPAGGVIQFWNGGPGLTQRLFRAAEGRGIGVVYDVLVLDLLTTAEGRVQGVRAQTLEGLADTIEVRNWSLVDAAHLLLGEAMVDKDWRFTALLHFKPLGEPPQAVDEALWAMLTRSIAEAQKITPTHFDVLLSAFTPPAFELTTYVDALYTWVSFHLPYLTVDLACSHDNRSLARTRFEQLAELCKDLALAEAVESLYQRRIGLWLEAETWQEHKEKGNKRLPCV